MEHWNLLIALHALGATFAVCTGVIVLWRPRKGGRAHRRLGAVWMASMYWTALSSFGIRELHPGRFSWIHLLSLWTLVSLSVALWAAVTGRSRLHRRWVVGSYAGLLGAGIAAMSFPQRLAPQLLLHHPVTFMAAVAVAAIAAVIAARAAGRIPGRTRQGEPVRSGR